MIHTPLLLWSYLQSNNETTASAECVFAPWALLLVLYMATVPKTVDDICSDLLLMGIHCTGLVVLFPHPAAFACSMNSLFNCALLLARDTTSACAFTLATLALAPAITCQINHTTWAIAWTECIHLVHRIAWALMLP